MKLLALLRSLLLALLVLVTGCSVSRPEPGPAPGGTREAAPTGKAKPDATATPAPVPPSPAPTVAAEADRLASDAAAAPPPPPYRPRLPAMAAPAYAAKQSRMAMIAPMPLPISPMPGDIDTENYTHRDTNPVQLVSEQPVSTFSIDVDTGAYTNVRRMLNAGRLPPADAVRAEEFINYFDYGYAPPADRAQPFSVTTELAPAPWNAQRQLLLVGIQGYRVPAAQIPASNLVFLIDTSGSMNEPDKLPLLKASLKQLVRQLRARDRVAIVT
jgi:Ca-activated chloride channel family protein